MPGEVYIAHFFTERVIRHEMDCAGGGGVPISSGDEEKAEHGTQCHGPVDWVVFSHRLDWIFQPT